ncbi:MAG: 4-coumarate--CoA ligase family protein [Pseudomonadota bacterium]
MIHRSPYPDVSIPATLLTPFVLQHARTLADKPALVDGSTGRTISYSEFEHQLKSLAGGLNQRGFGRGDVLAIMAPNIPEYAVAFHGTAWAGGAVTTINPTYTAHEVNHQLKDSGAKYLVTVSMFLDVAKAAAEGTDVLEIFTVDASAATPVSDLMGAPLEEQVPVDPTDVVALPYSSGTTGLSKGVVLTHRNLVANLVQTAAMLPIEPGETVLSFLPFFHIYGMQVLMNGALFQGGKVVTMPRFDLEQFLQLSQDHKVSRAFVAPPIVLALAKHPAVANYDLSALKSVFSGAAPLGPELAQEAGARLDCEVVQGYGMTELSPVSHATPAGQFKPGTIGVLVPSTECRIVDPESGKDLEPGEDGEIWVRGPQVMPGYLNNPDATANTIDADGWLHTGDVGHIDEDGHFTIVDRLKELIKYKGFQVPPAELESILVTHPDVTDAAVIGVPDDEAGELPKAFVVRREGAQTTAEDIQQFVAGQVAHYKQIRLVSFVDAIPKSASGKILRRMLREQ